MSFRLTHRPARGTINTPFGPRPKPTPTSPAIHYGQDYGWGGGDTICAAASGRVKSYAFSGAYGNRLVIDHGDGYETWYCHLTRNSVPENKQVAGGENIAVMGATGNVTAKHLHFEVRKNNVAVDPARFFSSSPANNQEEEDDMPSVLEILQASFEVPTTDGTKRTVQMHDALGAPYFYGDLQVALLREISEKLNANALTLLQASFKVPTSDGTERVVQMHEAMGAPYFYGDLQVALLREISEKLSKLPGGTAPAAAVDAATIRTIAVEVANEIYRRGEK